MVQQRASQLAFPAAVVRAARDLFLPGGQAAADTGAGPSPSPPQQPQQHQGRQQGGVDGTGTAAGCENSGDGAGEPAAVADSVLAAVVAAAMAGGPGGNADDAACVLPLGPLPSNSLCAPPAVAGGPSGEGGRSHVVHLQLGLVPEAGLLPGLVLAKGIPVEEALEELAYHW
jgi:hypothetical protein